MLDAGNDHEDAEGEALKRLFPGPQANVRLEGLYLNPPWMPPGTTSGPFVYANYIASLDGRISLPDARTDRRIVPPAIANARDWRLFQELAACCDALVASGRYVRDLKRGVTPTSFPVSGKPEFADLSRWRRDRKLAPQPAVIIVSASLSLPSFELAIASGRRVYVATGTAARPEKVARLESEGVRVLRAGEGVRVEGARLTAALAEEGFGNIYVIAGGEVLDALIADDVLDRLYLTQACTLLGGAAFDTLLKGRELEPPARFRLRALHYDQAGDRGVEQLFAVLDRGGSEPQDRAAARAARRR